MWETLVMTVKNKYTNRSKISEAKFREGIRLSVLNLDATQIAVLTGLNRNTVNRFLKALRERTPSTVKSSPPCPESSKSTSPSSVPDGSRGNGAAEPSERPLFLASSNGTGRLYRDRSELL